MSESIDLSGIYRAEGTQGAVVYGADVTITKLGNVYQLQWRSGPNLWTGIGVVQGNVLAVAMLAGGDGVLAYAIESTDDDIVLRGIWAYAADTRLSTENLYRTRAAGDRLKLPTEFRGRRAYPHAGGPRS